MDDPGTTREHGARASGIARELALALGGAAVVEQPTKDDIPTVWVPRERALDVLSHLRSGSKHAFSMLYDLTAIDERERRHREGQPPSDFTVVYHLLSFERNEDVRVKVALPEAGPSLPSATGLWHAADWYEREVFDMFGISFEGHPDLRRILLPPEWQGWPLRKDYDDPNIIRRPDYI